MRDVFDGAELKDTYSGRKEEADMMKRPREPRLPIEELEIAKYPIPRKTQTESIEEIRTLEEASSKRPVARAPSRYYTNWPVWGATTKILEADKTLKKVQNRVRLLMWERSVYYTLHGQHIY
jgi:hypothetical protein